MSDTNAALIEALEANTQAVTANTVLVERLIEMRETDIAKLRDLAEAAVGKKAPAAAKKAEPKAEAKVEPEVETPAPEKPKAEPKAETKAEESKPKVSGVSEELQACADAAGRYMKGSDRTEERDARSAKVKRILGQLKASKIGEIPADKATLFVQTIEKLIEAGDLTEAPAEEAEEVDDLDALLGA